MKASGGDAGGGMLDAVARVFFLVGVIGLAEIAVGQTPTPTPRVPAFKIDGRACGTLDRGSRAWELRGCDPLSAYFFAEVEVVCRSTGARVVMACPGGETRVETVPKGRP